MFRMSGKKVELYRYKVIYTEDEIEMIENCIFEVLENCNFLRDKYSITNWRG